MQSWEGEGEGEGEKEKKERDEPTNKLDYQHSIPG